MKMYELPKGFPTLPSAIIRIAVSDLKKELAKTFYKTDNGGWVIPISPNEDIYLVSLCHAVMTNTMNYPDYDSLDYEHMSNEFKRLTLCLLCLQAGFVESFLDYYISDALALPSDILQHHIYPSIYDDQGAKFIEQLKSLAIKLEKIGQ